MSRFNDRAEKTLVRSVSLAEDFGHTYIGSEHILLAMLESKDTIAGKLLSSRGITFALVSKAVGQYTGVGPQTKLFSEDFTPRVRKLLEAAYANSRKYANGVIDTEHILLALLEEKDAIAYKILKNSKCDITGLKDEIMQDLKAKQGVKADEGMKNLKLYGKDMVRMASEGKYDPVIGRDAETERLIRILTRKNKNNPCLIGEAGVGKTAIVEGLAMRIASGDVPSHLKDKLIFSLDLTNMVAGAKYRGDFEDRIKNVLNEVVKHGKIILFIDEIHTIVGAGAAEGAIDASNILKPQLSRGEIQIIGSTTLKEYHKYIERDAALERRFQPITVEEPDGATTLSMLHGLRDRYENHHGVAISDEAIKEAVSLCRRYITDRFFPDKAIDILDEACAYAVAKSQEEQRESNHDMRGDTSGHLSEAITDIISSIDISKGIRPTDPNAKTNVTPNHVRRVVAEICRLPIERLGGVTDYDDLEMALNTEIIGNEDAMHSLVMLLKRREFTSKTDRKPFASILVSNTPAEQAECLFDTLGIHCFGRENAVYRLDMREYSDKSSLTRLIGSPPGYEGHEDGGALTERVRRFPYSLICFERIDAACIEVRNIVTQIINKGVITDANSRTVSFQNCMILLTSDAETGNSIGFAEKDREKRNIGNRRSDELGADIKISLISPTNSKIELLVMRKLSDLANTVGLSGVKLQFSDEVIHHFVESLIGGNRSISVVNAKFKDHIEDPVIDYICATRCFDLMVGVADGKLTIRETIEIK